MDTQFVLYLLTFLLFISYEFEQTLFGRKWFVKNKEYLSKRFPYIAKRISYQLENISKKSFHFIALEKTILLILLLLFTLFAIRLEIWIGLIAMLTIRWLLVVILSITIKRLIPGTITAISGICFGLFMFWFTFRWYPVVYYIKWVVILSVLAAVNLWVMYAVATKKQKSQ